MSMSSTTLDRQSQHAAANHRNEGGPVWLSVAASLCLSIELITALITRRKAFKA